MFSMGTWIILLLIWCLIHESAHNSHTEPVNKLVFVDLVPNQTAEFQVFTTWLMPICEWSKKNGEPTKSLGGKPLPEGGSVAKVINPEWTRVNMPDWLEDIDENIKCKDSV